MRSLFMPGIDDRPGTGTDGAPLGCFPIRARTWSALLVVRFKENPSMTDKPTLPTRLMRPDVDLASVHFRDGIVLLPELQREGLELVVWILYLEAEAKAVARLVRSSMGSPSRYHLSCTCDRCDELRKSLDRLEELGP